MTPAFSTISEFVALLHDTPVADASALEAAHARDANLTKPPGSLGRLEDLAAWYCSWRGKERPLIERPQVIIFAGNHGVTARGVSAFPADVTAQMVLNFQAGGAAINQLAQVVGAQLDVIALQLETPTADFTTEPAMDKAEFVAALQEGWMAVDPQSDLLVVGEMGIGNTTSAAAVCLALYGGLAENWVGRGTGVDAAGLKLKAQVVAKGVDTHSGAAGLEVLRCLGGRELAAMAGAMAHARQMRIPVVLDGFICTAAAACLEHEVAGALDHVVAGHLSAEVAHAALLDRLGKEPLLALNMRLGEGSGATLAIAVVKAALACHSGMATFAEAGVSEG